MKCKLIKLKKTAPFNPYVKATRRLLRPVFNEYLLTKLVKIPQTHKGIYGDMRSIANFYKVKLTFHSKMVLAGQVSKSKRSIELCTKRKSGTGISPDRLRSTFCHELAHIIQMDLGIWKKTFTLSEAVRDEQEAETAGIQLFKFYFPTYKFSKSNFNSYFCEQDILYLFNYYKLNGIINDLFQFKDEKKIRTKRKSS